MPYRRTENVARRLAARHDAIIAAARLIAGEGGMAAVQIAAVAARAGIAAGTVYRYFPGKTDLVAALLDQIAESEIGALRRAAAGAPGPLSALSAAIMTFAARALRERRLAFAAIAEPVDAELDAARLAFRKSLAAEFGARIAAAIADGRLPEQDAAVAAAALTGLLIEGLIGPLAPDAAGREREMVQSLTLTALRALGVADARARGLVVQTVMPAGQACEQLSSGSGRRPFSRDGLSQMRQALGEQRARIIGRRERRMGANGLVPALHARKILPAAVLAEIGHADDRRHDRDVGERDVAAQQPGAAASCDLGIHALVAAAQPRHRRVHLLLRKAFAAHGQHELLAQRLRFRRMPRILLRSLRRSAAGKPG